MLLLWLFAMSNGFIFSFAWIRLYGTPSLLRLFGYSSVAFNVVCNLLTISWCCFSRLACCDFDFRGDSLMSWLLLPSDSSSFSIDLLTSPDSWLLTAPMLDDVDSGLARNESNSFATAGFFRHPHLLIRECHANTVTKSIQNLIKRMVSDLSHVTVSRQIDDLFKS